MSYFLFTFSSMKDDKSHSNDDTTSHLKACNPTPNTDYAQPQPKHSQVGMMQGRHIHFALSAENKYSILYRSGHGSAH